MMRGTGKTQSIMIWDEYGRQLTRLTRMSHRLRNNDTPTQAYFIHTRGKPEAITIPAKADFVSFLRKMYAELGGGKLYVPRQMSLYGKDPEWSSNWEVVMWGGGRQKSNKIKVMTVGKSDVPKTLRLIELVTGNAEDVAGNT